MTTTLTEVTGRKADVSGWEDLDVETARCHRCGGLMVVEFCSDCSANGEESTVKRCVQCGEMVDPVILRNRSMHITKVAKGRMVMP